MWHRAWSQLRRNLNFYRLHVLFFTFTPLIAAGIFYASNGGNHIPFIDALYLCVSSITVTGLATIDLSSATPGQQVILFILMCMGSPVTVSWVIVYVRRNYFAKKFEHVVASQLSSVVTPTSTSDFETKWFNRLFPWRKIKLKHTQKNQPVDGHKHRTKRSKVRPDMIRRVEGAPQLVDPSGWVDSSRSEIATTDLVPNGRQGSPVARPTPLDNIESDSDLECDPSSVDPVPAPETTPPAAPQRLRTAWHPRRSSSFDPGYHTRSRLSIQSLSGENAERERPLTAFPASPGGRDRRFPRTQTIEFVQPDLDQIHAYDRNHTFGGGHLHEVVGGTSPTVRRKRGFIREPEGPNPHDPGAMKGNSTYEHLHSGCGWQGTEPARTATMQSNRSSVRPPRLRPKEEDFGGFPLPHVILTRLLRRFFPRLEQRLTRTVTIPHTMTVQSQRGGQTAVLGGKAVPYISFDAIVGRNSTFRALNRENLEELGGVEYRALNMLLWIVGLYHVGVPLFAFVIIAPYISQPRWRDVFRPPQQHRFVSPVWYSLFQVISAYTNTGTSLVDQSMVPFQKAYPEVLSLPFIILAGNTAFPVFLRFVIWSITKFVNKHSRSNETLHFLLDHPRRCFIYLFPSHQTWFLLFILFLLNFTDWFFFLVLDIGNPAIKTVPLGTRFAIGLLQATAVRSAGFSTIALSALAPAVKVLYVVMMYVSVYPIAMSVRSTNVYEERSLGVFEDNSDEEEEEAALGYGGRSRARIWGKYLAAHARKQLSFDMWWLAFALFLVCIVEKQSLEDDNNATWFNIFTIIFELTSAYGTVGLSLGTPNANYSFSGALRPLSKLIFCAVMLRGRHRGLPVAIDRAVLLPAEFKKSSGDEDESRVTYSNAPRVNSMDSRGAHGEKSFEQQDEVARNKLEDDHAGGPQETTVASGHEVEHNVDHNQCGL